MPSLRPSFLIPLVVALLIGCGGSSPSGTGAAALQGPVQLAERGKNRATFDQAWIEGHAPAFSWGQGRGWRLQPFFSDRWGKPGFELRVSSATGDAVVFPNPGSRRDGREPVLIVNLKGEALVTLVGADGNPDSFHGRGGARKRSGDESTRIVGVTRVELLEGSGPAEAVAAAPTALRVTGLAAPSQLTVAQLEALPKHAVTDDRGTPRGVEAWDLRDVVGLFGAPAVLGVMDASGAVTPIDAATWADATRRPTLRLNRRGAWRFQWLGPDGAVLWNLPSAGNVAELQLQAP